MQLLIACARLLRVLNDENLLEKLSKDSEELAEKAIKLSDEKLK